MFLVCEGIGVWGKYKIALRPWEIPDVSLLEYEESEQFVDLAEEPKPYEGTFPGGRITVAFVDGVRRTEYALYLIDDNGSSYEGAFASLGAGAIIVELGKLNSVRESMIYPIIKRYLVVKGIFEDMQYQGVFEMRTTQDDVSKEINRVMREELEVSVARKVAKELKPTLLICDGTLSNRLRGTLCVGYVKTIKKLFIRREDAYMLNELRCGQRTPIIKVHYQRGQEEKEKVEKYTWYVKLTEGEGIGSLARLEVFEKVGLEITKHIADLTAGILPRLVSSTFQDRRSPQNLLPIKSLENFLRRHLGSYSIVRREIEKLIYA
ncbi:MAG: DNA double-strand break repair nuclease NurA [Hydrogenobacter sp.]